MAEVLVEADSAAEVGVLAAEDEVALAILADVAILAADVADSVVAGVGLVRILTLVPLRVKIRKLHSIKR